MKFYFMQHGEAMKQEEHPDRPLTEQGHKDVSRVAEFLARAAVRIDCIRHSGKRRAEQTANIVAQKLQVQTVEAVSGINPNDDVKPIADALSGETQSVLLVGHLPFLCRLVSSLLTRDSEHIVVQFQMGGVVCLSRQDEQWSLTWMVAPELFR